MSADKFDKLTSELHSERQKSALYEKKLRVAVESCKSLKAEKENLANIIAGFACAEVKSGENVVDDLKQKVGLLTKEFQSKESALVLARNTVLKENSDLKKLLDSNSINSSGKIDSKFLIAELEQKLRKETSMNRKYEKKLQQLEEQLENSFTNDNKFEIAKKRLEEEREQFKKLYEEAHARSIYLERKFTSIQLDQRKTQEEITKSEINELKNDDEIRVSNLEKQIMNLSLKCDEKENEISELSTFITVLKGENLSLKDNIEKLERVTPEKPKKVNFSELMEEEYSKFCVNNGNCLEFLTISVRNDVNRIIEECKTKQSNEDQVKQQQSQISNLQNTINVLNMKINENDDFRVEFEKKLKKLEQTINKRDERIGIQKEELQSIKVSLRSEISKRDELEEEMYKQRYRAQEEIDSRDKEIEAFKKMLVSFRNEKLDRTSPNARKVSRHNRSSTHEDDQNRRSRTFSQEDSGNVPNDPDSKNVYYENQLTKKDYDIQELRKQLMDVEVRLRENESVAMSRQLESVARGEEMNEKVRLLEGKLQMLSSTNEIDYLRNIFTQFLHSMSSPSPSSKAILKAMGSVLKVPISEMKLIDRK